MSRAFVAAALFTLLGAVEAKAYLGTTEGEPIAKPLPTWCQMGHCSIQTIESIDPVSFSREGVLFRVESQNWNFEFDNPRRKSRGPDGTSYVFCSKELPTIIQEINQRKFVLIFLVPNDSGSYHHSNKTQMDLYFAVCHARIFKDTDSAAEYAGALGYKITPRDDQPIVDKPDEILRFLKNRVVPPIEPVASPGGPPIQIPPMRRRTHDSSHANSTTGDIFGD